MITLKADRRFVRFEEITPDILKAERVKLLLCDLDNTLRLRSERQASEALREWVETCQKAGVKIVIISNNVFDKRLQKFCAPLGVPYVSWAKKPIKTKLVQTMREYDVKPENTVMLGDKKSTDVLAAKMAGVRAWQVKKRKDVL